MTKKLLCHFDTVQTVFFDTVYHFSTHSFQNDYFHTKFIIFFEIFVQQKKYLSSKYYFYQNILYIHFYILQRIILFYQNIYKIFHRFLKSWHAVCNSVLRKA